MKDYGSIIAKYRKESNLTQKDLATMLFVTPQAVSKWEQNQSEPDLETIRKLAEIFNVNVDVFFLVDDLNKDKVVKDSLEKLNCTWCNNEFNQEELHQIKPYPLCKKCHQENIDAKNTYDTYIKDDEKLNLKIKNASFKNLLITSLILFVVVLGFTLWTYFTDDQDPDFLTGGLALSVLLPLFVVQVFREGPLQDVFLRILTFSVRMPGVIFELSFDGLKFLIFVKILFAVISILISIAMLFLAIIVSLLISPFTFIYMLIKYKRGEADEL